MARFSIFCALLAMTVAPTRLTLVSAAPLCPLGDATLNGTYIVSGGGTVATVGPVTSVGEVTYDGKGNSDATYTVSLNGAMHTITVTGTYTVNADCTATAVEVPNHFNFVVSPNGSSANWMATDSGTVLSGTLVRLRPLDSFEDAARLHSGNRVGIPATLRQDPKTPAVRKPKVLHASERSSSGS